MKDFDIVLAGDFRLIGGTSSAIAAEIRAYVSAGLKVGLLPLHAHFFPAGQPVHQEISRLIADHSITVLRAGGDNCTCTLLLLHNPIVLQNAPLEAVNLRSKYRLIIAHHVPQTRTGALNYEPWDIEARVCRAYGGGAIWAPISPVCRASFRRLAFDLPILSSNWHNVIHVEDWGTPRSHPRHRRISIGRHSRPDPDKWPSNREDFLAAYPNSENVDVHFLGGEQLIDLGLGKLPRNWHLYPFGHFSPRTFLEMIDFYVYFHHPETIEAFGRAPAEAAAAGCVVILPPYMQATFGPAALYCEPRDVKNILLALHRDPAAFAAQSQAGHAYTKANFGPDSLLRLCTTTMARPVIDEDLLTHAGTAMARLRRTHSRVQYRIRRRWNDFRLVANTA